MQQRQTTYTQTLLSGEVLTITADRAEADRALRRGEITAYDDRHAQNPSFQILRSCDIRSRRIRREVLQALIAYDAAQPTDPRWQRTPPSLEREWLLHNFAYRIGFLRSHARDVDLDNRAEGKGALGFAIKSAAKEILKHLKPR